MVNHLLKVVETAASRLPIARSAVYTWMDVQEGSPDSDLIDQLIDSAFDVVENYLGYPLREQRYEEWLEGNRTNYLLLHRTPLKAIHSVKFYDWEVPASQYQVSDPSAGIVYRQYGWIQSYGSRRSDFLSQDYIPEQPYLDYRIQYTAGYTDTKDLEDDEVAAVPAHLKLPSAITQAIAFVVRGWWISRRTNPSIQVKKVGDLSVTYFNPSRQLSHLPIEAENLLQSYQRVTA